MSPSVNILSSNAVSHLANFKRSVADAVPGVEKLILFGSQARGQMRDDSDYDVAVILRDMADRRHVRRILSCCAIFSLQRWVAQALSHPTVIGRNAVRLVQCQAALASYNR